MSGHAIDIYQVFILKLIVIGPAIRTEIFHVKLFPHFSLK